MYDSMSRSKALGNYVKHVYSPYTHASIQYFNTREGTQGQDVLAATYLSVLVLQHLRCSLRCLSC